MTLSFSTKWPKQMGKLAGQPNYFINKIWMSLNIEHKQKAYEYFYDTHVHQVDKVWDIPDEKINPKLHTIRAGNRWKAGMLIHPVINNRTKDRFQFAPTMNCEAVQDIVIQHYSGQVLVFIGGELFGEAYYHFGFDDVYDITVDLEKLAINDGFESIEHFFAYFNTDFKGQIIHWTDLRY